MVQSQQTEGWLVMDCGDKIPNVEEAFSITCTGAGQNPGPMTRSVFKLIRVDDMDIFGSDELIRYGQKIKFESNPYLYRKKLQLSSYRKSHNVCAPISGF